MPVDRKIKALVIFGILIAVLALFLPQTVFTEIQYINATNITTVGAASTEGSLQNISDINQGYYNVSEGNAQPFYTIVNFTNVTNFSFVEIKAKYFSVSASPSSHIVDLEIFCTTDNEYEDLFFLENTDSWRYFTRHFPDDMHFIDAQGNVSIKFNHASNGNVNHRLWIDTVRLVVLPQFEESTINLTQYINSTRDGCIGNCSFNNISVNAISKNDTTDTYLNKIYLNNPLIHSESNHNSILDLGETALQYTHENLTSGNTGNVIVNESQISMSVGDGAYSEQALFQYYYRVLISGGGEYSFNNTTFDMHNASLVNCSNCGGEQNLSQVLTQGNDANNQSITNIRNINHSIVNGSFAGFTMLGSAGTPFMTAWENITMRSELTLGGIQIWKVRSTVLDPVGYIVYSTPNDKPGIVMYNGSLSRRINFMARDTGVMINAAETSSFKSTGLLVDNADNITVSGLVGTGNAYVCVNATGYIYRGNPGC